MSGRYSAPLDTNAVNAWIDSLRDGRDSGAQQLWEHYFQRLVAVARNRFGSAKRVGYDEEDAAQSAFKSFCLGVQNNRYPDVRDPDSLWRLLVVITARKVAYRKRHDFAARRGGGAVMRESDLNAQQDGVGLDAILGTEPSPDFGAEFADQCERLVAELHDPLLRDITRLKLEGWTIDEISERLGSRRRTVQRKLALVRGKWQTWSAP